MDGQHRLKPRLGAKRSQKQGFIFKNKERIEAETGPWGALGVSRDALGVPGVHWRWRGESWGYPGAVSGGSWRYLGVPQGYWGWSQGVLGVSRAPLGGIGGAWRYLGVPQGVFGEVPEGPGDIEGLSLIHI